MGRKNENVQKRPLQILFVGNFKTISVGEPEIANCLEGLGHNVTRLQEKETHVPDLVEELKKKDYDFLLFAKFRVGTYGEREAFLKTLRIPSVMWGFDLYFGL